MSSAPFGHLCWAYDDPAQFDSRAQEFLGEGLAAGERVWYVTAGQPAATVERLSGASGFADALRRGAVQVGPVSLAHAGSVIEPAAQVGAYAAATERALASGYAGLRVVAEATPMVRTPAQLDAVARYEHLIDRYMRTRPLSAMCAYNRVELGDRAVAELACMHPEGNADEVIFRVYGCGSGDGCAELAGEVDLSNHELFATALQRADLSPVGDQLVVHATALRFIDHRSLMFLRDYARQRGADAVLRTSRSVVARLVELLDLPGIKVQAAQ